VYSIQQTIQLLIDSDPKKYYTKSRLRSASINEPAKNEYTKFNFNTKLCLPFCVEVGNIMEIVKNLFP